MRFHPGAKALNVNSLTQIPVECDIQISNIKCMNWFLLAATILSFVTFMVHLIIGGREIAAPLLKSGLDPISKLTAYYCWHMATLMLLSMTGAFSYALFSPGNVALVVTMMIFSIGCTLLSFGLIIAYRVSPMQLPQWLFFILISIFAALSL